MVWGIHGTHSFLLLDNLQQHQVQQMSHEALPVKKESPLASKELLNKLINHLNTVVSETSHVKFEMHEKLHEYYIKVINDQTQEVIKEIPSKKALDMYAAMKETFGLFIDEKS